MLRVVIAFFVFVTLTFVTLTSAVNDDSPDSYTEVLSQEAKDLFIYNHNLLRNQTALQVIMSMNSHKEKRMSCPHFHYKCKNTRCVKNKVTCDGVDDCGDNSDENCVSSLPPLVWSDSLAATAAISSRKCEFRHFDSGYGQNIYLGFDWENGEIAANTSCAMWEAEIANVEDPPSWKCIATDNNDVTCGHYSQMVWKRSTEIGCAVTRGCVLWGQKWTMVYCEYNPAGNIVTGYTEPMAIFPPY